jgi:DNA-binding beta-propeller fold protein YncE
LAGSGEVAFIDIEAAAVSGSLRLPDRASLPLALAATADGSSVVVACNTGYVSFLSGGGVTTRELLSGPETNDGGLTPIPNEFLGVTLTPDGAIALVSEANEQGQLFRFDVVTTEPVGVPWSCGDDPSKVVVTPDGLTAYMVDNQRLQVVNLSNGTCTPEELQLGEIGSLELVATNPSRAILTVPDGDRVVLMNTATWQPLDDQVVAPPGRLFEPNVFAVSPDGTLAIVANHVDQSITFVGVSDSALTLGATIPVGGSGGGVAFSPDGETAVVTLLNSSLVKIVDVPSQQVRATVSVGLGLVPAGVTVVGDLPPWAADVDEDGVVAALDCDDANSSTFPGAPEVLDGDDNQCPGDAGHGEIDEGTEVQGLVFISSSPGAPEVLCWDQLAGVTGYEVAEARNPLFADACEPQFLPPARCQTTNPVPPGQVRFYLVHAFGCFPDCMGGTWGRDSANMPRTVPCSEYPPPSNARTVTPGSP